MPSSPVPILLQAEESTPAQLESLPELAPAEEHAPSAGPSAWDSDEESEASDLSEATQETGLSTGSAAKRRVGSIASTYWRPERNDRTDQLSMIDERWPPSLLDHPSTRPACFPALAQLLWPPGAHGVVLGGCDDSECCPMRAGSMYTHAGPLESRHA